MFNTVPMITYHRDHMRNSISRIDYSSSESSLFYVLGSPRSSKSKYCLHSDVQSWYVEGFEHNLSSEFTILGGIERRFSLR